MPKVFANGVDLHYLRVGTGPHLVMLHGLTGNQAVWHLTMVPLLRQSFCITTYDMRGHGKSGMPPTGYTTDDMADDLKGLMDALEIERAYLVGHSYGADAMLNFAVRYPERIHKLMIIEATVPALIHLRNRDDWEGWRFWSEALESFGVHVPPEKRTDIDYMIRLSLQVPKVYGPATGRARKPESTLALLDTTTMVKDYEAVGALTLEAIERITTPTLIMYGEGSAYLGTFRYLVEHLPNGEPDLLPRTEWGGHFGPLEQPELLVERMLRFFGMHTEAKDHYLFTNT
ncbi:MAG TPA: alpha/beta hydrolase [Chloroflexota bacterium]|nr:alpha/beta hydrolase [Chloroflexota bacterium]